MPYGLRDRAGTDGTDTPTIESPGLGPDFKCEVWGPLQGPTGEGIEEVKAQQVEQLLDMFGRLARPAQVHNTFPC